MEKVEITAIGKDDPIQLDEVWQDHRPICPACNQVITGLIINSVFRIPLRMVLCGHCKGILGGLEK